MKKAAVYFAAAGAAFLLAGAALTGAAGEWPQLLSVRVSCAKWRDARLLSAPCADSSALARARKIAGEHAGKNLLGVDIARLRARLSRIPGVAEARLRRRLPHTLTALLIMHEPLAQWADGGLVDVAGRRYEGGAQGWLPIFKGGEGSAAEITEFYGFAGGVLPGGEIGQVQLDGDGEWKLFLRDGAVLYLGSDSPRARLRRFARHRAALAERFAAVRSVDLRYPRGFSVVAGGEEKETKKEKHK